MNILGLISQLIGIKTLRLTHTHTWLNREGVIGKHLMGREKIALPGWTVEIDEEREKGLRKENRMNLMKKKEKERVEGDEKSGRERKRGEGKINTCKEREGKRYTWRVR